MGETDATGGLRARATVAILAATVLVMAAACGSSSSDNASSSDDGSESGAIDSGIQITGAWARVSPMMVDAGAVYLEITATETDRLLSVSVDPSVAESAQLHETVTVDDDMGSDDTGSDDMGSDDTGSDDMGSDDMGSDDTGSDDMGSDDTMAGDQAMTMRELTDGLELPAGEPVALAPGGYHIMLLGLTEPLVEGETFEVDLDFENAGTQTITVEVRTAAP